MSDWKALIPAYNKMSEFGLMNFEWQKYRVKTKRKLIDVKSMLSPYEITFLYHTAKNVYTNNGAIVDLGPFYGLSTYAFASGIANNKKKKSFDLKSRKHIYTYDLYLSSGFDWFIEECPKTGSIFMDFYEIVRDYIDMIHISPGDFMNMTWREHPVEVLFVDIAKTFELNDHVIQNFFPNLIIGSTLIQQDYVYFSEYWVQLTMEIFKEYFELQEFIMGASAVYKVTKPIPKHYQNFSIKKEFSDNELIKMHELIVDGSDAYVKDVIKCAHCKLLYDLGRYKESFEYLQTVSTKKLTDDPIIDFCEIARSNKIMMERLLESHKTGDNNEK